MLTAGWQGAQRVPALGKGFPDAAIWEAPAELRERSFDQIALRGNNGA